MRTCPALPVCIALAWLGVGNVNAMEIKPDTWNGHSVLRATGEIASGDARRFAALLRGIKASPHGLPVVLLDSRGGDVQEALAISNVFSEKEVHTVVPAGKSCKSACASIVFVAGRQRTIEEGGTLGQHSCAQSGGLKDADCNERISNHAIGHGVSHGSIQAFITHAAPSAMVFFTRSEADCWGITRYPFVEESGFEKSEPCFYRAITKKWPTAQSVWRVDFKADGYRAFTRPNGDHVREGEMSIYCRKAFPGLLFLSVDISGPSEEISKSIRSAALDAAPISYRDLPVTVAQADAKYAQVSVGIKKEHVALFLKNVSFVALTLERSPPQAPLFVPSLVSTSRKALSFAAANCMS